MDFSLIQERSYVDTFPGGDYHYDLEENLGDCVPAAIGEHWTEIKPVVLSEETLDILESFQQGAHRV